MLASVIILLVFCSLVGFSIGSTVLSIGKPRKPITPGVALAVLIVGSLEIVGLIHLFTH